MTDIKQQTASIFKKTNKGQEVVKGSKTTALIIKSMKSGKDTKEVLELFPQNFFFKEKETRTTVFASILYNCEPTTIHRNSILEVNPLDEPSPIKKLKSRNLCVLPNSAPLLSIRAGIRTQISYCPIKESIFYNIPSVISNLYVFQEYR